MYNVAFSQNKIDEINSKVKKYIAPHLFVFCNYNPDSINTISIDARFILAVMNMYKLLVDASICSGVFKIADQNFIEYDKREIKDINQRIGMLRSVLGHNLDEKNGNDEEKKKMEKWFRSVIKKDSPMTEQDYRIALEEIEKYGDTLCEALIEVIEKLSNSDKKEIVVDVWEKTIISFYKRPNSERIIEGQLCLAYQARFYNPSQKMGKYDVACWVKKRICHPEEQENESLKDLLKKLNYGSSAYRKIKSKIDENNISLCDKNKQVAELSRKDVDKIGVYDYLTYYVKEIIGKIELKINNNKVDSLLPQSIIQEIIKADFSVMD